MVVAVIYLTLFHDRRNHFIEAFIVLMLIKAITFFIYNIWMQAPGIPAGFNDSVDYSSLYWIIITNFIFHFGYTLQEFLTWIMVSFIAVLFGQVVLILKLALQDPLKLKFASLVGKKTGQGSVSDGYSGLRDRLNHVTFSDIETQPLDPKVVSKAWSESWKDYLIVGLATVVPSVGVYQLTGSSYTVSVIIFLTWIYRFGYPASNRIAKGLGIRLGDRDIGSEMMRGVLGWFFRLNILLSLAFIGFEVWERMQAGTLPELGSFYLGGLILATPPILFALILLPMTEGFSQILYRRVFEGIRSARIKLSSISMRGTMLNLSSAIGTGVLATGAFLGAVMGVTLNFAFNYMGSFFVYPDQVDEKVQEITLGAINNNGFIPPTIWTLLMLVIPLGMMLLLGILGNYVRQRFKGGVESFAFYSALLVSVAVWFVLPGMDYAISTIPTPASVAGLLFFRLRPIIVIPTGPEYLVRLAYEFIVNVPIYISAALFVLYYFEFHKQWRRETGEAVGPLLTVHARDIWDSVGMFTMGIVGSVLGVLLLSRLIDLPILDWLVSSVIFEIGSPNGLEFVFMQLVGGPGFFLFVEHNVIRTLLMLVAGPVFWTLALWLVAVKGRTEGAIRVSWASLFATAMAALVAFVWTLLDAMAGKLHLGWPFVADLGLRAVVVLGILFIATLAVHVFNLVVHKNSRGWWFPPLLMLFAIEYFIYDDQFALIALVALPLILTAFYRIGSNGKPEVKNEGFLITYLRISLMSLAIAEVLSTALWVAGVGTITWLVGLNVTRYLAVTLTHGVIEIPAFLFAAAVSLRIARNLAPSIQARDWGSIRYKTWTLLTDLRLWRTYILVLFFLLIGALVEANISPIVFAMFGP